MDIGISSVNKWQSRSAHSRKTINKPKPSESPGNSAKTTSVQTTALAALYSSDAIC